MFQNFDDHSDPSASAGRVAALRERLAGAGLTGFVVPRTDEYQNEYVPPSEERLAWLTGFTGSAGMAIVLRNRAVLFVDGRYTLQARDQVDSLIFELAHLVETPPEQWLAASLGPDQRLGYDPRLHTIAGLRKLEAAVEKAGSTLVAVGDNPIDLVWLDRPPRPLAPVTLHPEELAGESAPAKLARIAEAIEKAGADALVLTEPDAVAWTFNIRGGDVAHTPLPLSYAIIRRAGRPTLVIDGRKLSNEVRSTLAEITDIAEPSRLANELERLSSSKVRIDPARASAFVASRLRESGAVLVEGNDPVAAMKAVKNAAELAGARAAHQRDGLAVTRFLAWLDREAPTGRLDEIAAAEALERFRADTGALKEISFPTISGAGPNGAIVHYRVTRRTSRPLERGTLYLVDSGAQYEDGTTDITRTVAIGEPDSEMRRHFTLVLKGHVTIATARFPRGTTGAQLDSLARIALWKAGLDFDHGTGHGVGSYLSVHEGPQRISKLGHVALEPGMILSNEPGLYLEGRYGIRIENLVAVAPPRPIEGGDRDMLGFETLTLAPIDRRLVDVSILTNEERSWVDTYHARVHEILAPLLKGAEREWLEASTAPL